VLSQPRTQARNGTFRPPVRRLSNLPAQPTPLIGRAADLTRMQTWLMSPAVRLITLTGPAGIGKTRLALEVAAGLLDAFEGGTCLVDLAPIGDPTLVVPAIARTLSVREAGDEPVLARLIQALRDRRLLLVLDNFEQVLPAAPEVADLLARCPLLKILVTSRAPLHLRWEHRYPVPPLALPDLDRPPDVHVLGECPAVALFVDRARAVRPDFRLTTNNARAVAELCTHLDGMPLAIELAAAHSDVLAPRDMLVRLTQRLPLLDAGPRDLPARQQTIWTAITWSYDLLDAGERALFRRLSVFAGGWTREAAEAICAGEGIEAAETLRLLSRLVDQSLVLMGEPDGAARYRLLEMVRQYAAERLDEAGATASIRCRHARWYLTLAEEAERKSAGPEQTAWLDRLEAEHDNLRAALGWVLEHDATLALRLAGALGWFWDLRGYYSEGRRWLQAACSLSAPTPGRAGTSVYARAKACRRAGDLARRQDDRAEAVGLLDEALRLYRELGASEGIAATLNSLGMVAFVQSDYARAAALQEESLTVARALGDRWAIAAALTDLGRVLWWHDDYDRATALWEECLAIRRDLGDTAGIALSLHRLGNVYWWQRDYPRSTRLFEECLALYRELGDRAGIAATLNNLGINAGDQGDYERAVVLLEESLTLYRDMGATAGYANVLSSLGTVLYHQSDDERAGAIFRESLDLSRPLGETRVISADLIGLAQIARRRGDERLAASLYRENVPLCLRKQDQQQLAAGLEGLAGVEVAEGEAERAARLLGAAEALRERCRSPLAPAERPDYEQTLAALHKALDERCLALAWSAGRAMTVEQVAEEALASPETSRRRPAAPGGKPGGVAAAPLTLREQEVAALIAQGLTNRAIAARLVVSRRTVETHAEHIPRKLGFTSRAQIAVWAAEHGLRSSSP
jgi:predicted ATPase/DNA-binding CsgD family transcriptional regulator